MHISPDQRCVIIENDAKAMEELRALYRRGLPPERVARLRSNIEGNAMKRWRERCAAAGQPIELAIKQINKQLA